jgi:hypothetical protein
MAIIQNYCQHYWRELLASGSLGFIAFIIALPLWR